VAIGAKNGNEKKIGGIEQRGFRAECDIA